MSSKQKRHRTKLAAAILLLLLLLLLLFKCTRTRSSDASFDLPVDFRDVPFVELIYQQSFRPFNDSPLPVPEQTWSRRTGYLLQERSASLFTNDGRETAMTTGAFVGRRLWFHHHLWPHSFDQTSQLHEVDAELHVWRVAAEPTVDALSDFDALCHVRAPIEANVKFEGSVAEVTVGGETRKLAAVESTIFAVPAVELALDEYIKMMKQRLGPPEAGKEVTPEWLLEHQKMLGLTGSPPKLTLHAQLRVVSHTGVRIADKDLAVLWREGERAFNEGDYETAMQRYQVMANVLPEEKTVANMLAMAMHPPPQLKDRVTVSGSIEYPSQPTAELEFPPYVKATTLDPGSAASAPEVEYITEPEGYAIRLKPGRYRLELHMPGHAVATTEIDVKENFTQNFKLGGQP